MYHVPIRITDSSPDADFSMDDKTQSDHKQYLKLLREMTVEQKLQIVFELTERERTALRQALRLEFPNATEPELHRLFLERWHGTDDCAG